MIYRLLADAVLVIHLAFILYAVKNGEAINKGEMPIESLGVRVPHPLGRCSIPGDPSPWTEALLMEDLGDCTPAVEHIKALEQ